MYVTLVAALDEETLTEEQKMAQTILLETEWFSFIWC